MRRFVLACGALAFLTATAATAEWTFGKDKEVATKAGVEQQPANRARIYLTPEQQLEARPAGIAGGEVKSLLNVQGPLNYGQFVWSDRGVPAGPVWIRVDLKSQILSVFRNGDEIGTAVILYGADQKETPQGVFPILARDKDHRSNTYDDAPMPYALRLTPDGVSIHGSNVRWGYATHGCIGVPVAFAKLLFDQVKKGDDVLIVGGHRQNT